MSSSDKWMQRAEERLKAASILIENHLPVEAINRLFYAVHAATKSLLTYHNIDTKSHRGVIIEFGKVFVKTGEIELEYSKTLAKLHDLRDKADYELFTSINENQANELLEEATSFVNRIKKYLDDWN